MPDGLQIKAPEELENCRHSCIKKLCLLITDEEPQYLIKAQHQYQHFLTLFLDESHKEWDYKYTTTRRKHTYEFVELSDIEQNMRPLYY